MAVEESKPQSKVGMETMMTSRCGELLVIAATRRQRGKSSPVYEGFRIINRESGKLDLLGDVNVAFVLLGPDLVLFVPS